MDLQDGQEYQKEIPTFLIPSLKWARCHLLHLGPWWICSFWLKGGKVWHGHLIFQTKLDIVFVSGRVVSISPDEAGTFTESVPGWFPSQWQRRRPKGNPRGDLGGWVGGRNEDAEPRGLPSQQQWRRPKGNPRGDPGGLSWREEWRCTWKGNQSNSTLNVGIALEY